DVRATNLIILKIINLAARDVERAEMIEDAPQMMLTPQRPAAVACSAIGELHDLAALQIQPVKLHRAATLGMKNEIAIVGRNAGNEVVERIVVGQPGRKLADRPPCSRV